MAKFDKLDRLLKQFVEEGLPGCAMKIVQHGDTIFEGYYGYADVESGKPLTKDSLFRQASLSKIPLYTAAMILYEKGKFNLTDPIGEYLPEWKESKKFDRHPNGELFIVPVDEMRPPLLSFRFLHRGSHAEVHAGVHETALGEGPLHRTGTHRSHVQGCPGI